MEVAVANAKRLLTRWEYEYDIEAMGDGEVLMVALVVADRALLRYKAGLEWRCPSA